jgi:hypothetical protein
MPQQDSNLQSSKLATVGSSFRPWCHWDQPFFMLVHQILSVPQIAKCQRETEISEVPQIMKSVTQKSVSTTVVMLQCALIKDIHSMGFTFAEIYITTVHVQ